MPYTLIILLFICHWLADYTHLQRPWMLKAKATGSPAIHILLHALVHGLLFLCCLYFFTSGKVLWFLFLLEWITHFVIDVWKGKMNVWFPNIKNPINQFHWIVFGFDQLLHHAIIVVIVYWVLNPPVFLQ